MPVTISYDMEKAKPNDRTYLRSMLERFGWQRLGGSVFRYPSTTATSSVHHEDWLNAVVPALMFFRSFVLQRKLKLTKFTLDASSVSFVDLSDPRAFLGKRITRGRDLPLVDPTNTQSAEQKLRDFIDKSTSATA